MDENPPTVIAIQLRKERGEPLVAVQEARAVPGRGLEGDRRFDASPAIQAKPGTAITLIEQEQVDGYVQRTGNAFTALESRRNLVTRGIDLNALVGKTFKVGEVELRGDRLCQPCGHLEDLCHADMRKELHDRGGLRADVLSEGVIRVGDGVVA